MSVTMNAAKIRSISQALGHTGVAIIPQPNGTWWNVVCDCGYRSTRRRTAALAADAAYHHLVKVTEAHAASGRNIAPHVADTPDASVVFRQTDVAS